jgi:dynein heavy chain
MRCGVESYCSVENVIVKIRPYPGEIREIKRGVDGAVYADDLEKEEALKQSFGKGMSQEVSKEDLMLSADFLKLDQSKLPLEMFDNLEYESLDRSPEEWMMASRRGTIPFYDSGSWTWRSVQVLGYNTDTNEYHVQFSPDGAKKFVGRLNLRFDEEEESAFTARRNFAKSAREEAKKVLRLDHFIGQQPKEAIRAIRQTSLHKIHERIIEGLPASIPFPEQGSPLGSLLSNLTKQLILFYSRAMKTTVVFAQLSEAPRYRREATVERYKQLDLPAVPAKPPVPRSGKVACPEPEVPYSLSRARIAASHCSSKKEILNVFKWLHDRWNRRFQNYAFMDVQLEGVTLPCSLDAFKRAQGERLENTAKQLKTELRTAFLDHFLDCVQDVFDLFQSNMAAYKAGALFRLHRVLDLTLQTFLRQILLSSLDEWKRLVERNTRCTVDDPKAPSLSLRATEVTFSLSTRTPMFLVELRVMNGKVVLEPSAEDIQSSFVAKIDSMVAVLRGVLSVDKDTMNLLTLENRVLLNIGEGDPMFADLDAVVSQAKSFVSSHIAAAMKRPLALAKLYEEYMWLMEYDEYIDGFSVQVPPPSQEDFKRELLKLDGAVKTIQNISFGQEDFDLVRVDTAGAKEMLSRHAREMRDGLLTMVVNGAKQEHIDIVEKYNAMLNRIAEKPANEKQLADLRDYIISSKEAVTELQSRVAESRRNLSILDSFSVPLPEEDMILSWEILKFPARIESSGREVEMSLETDKDRMMAKLTADREHFSKLVDKLGEDVQQAKLQADYGDKEKIVERFNQLMDSIQGAKAKGEDFNMRERVFGFVTTDYGVLDHYVEELHPFNTLWIIVSDFHNERNDWLNGDFSELDGKEIEEKMTEWWKTSFKLAKSLEEEYEEVSACAMKLREETSEFRSHLPVIQSLASKALKDTHWDKISELLGKSIDPQDDLHLQDLLDLDAAAHIEEIQEITIAAEKEYNLERQLDGMTHDWDAVEFEVKPYRSTGTFVVSGIDDIMTLLDDHIVKTQTMRGNPFIKPIEEKCKDWEIKLKYAQGLLEEWTKCQRTWMYLEPIFGSDDIVRQLPAESKKFKGVDSLWRKTLEGTNTDANFMRNADPEKRLEEKFKKANEKLDEIQKGLNEYLETKRLYFPRFFFLSDDELLEILSQTKEPRAVQPHLGKCFEGINKVKFESDLKISQMISSEDEVVKMDRPIDPETTANKGNVERWLLELESIQWDSIRTLTVGSIEQYKSIKRNDWILNWPAQVILGVSSLYWTVEVTQALAANGGDALKGCRDNLNHQLKDIVNLVRGKLDKLQRKTLGALTTIDVHNRDVVEKMVDLGTHEVTDFEWVSQLRYYWEDSWKDGQGVKRGQKTLVARIVNAKCLYGYEYLGNSSRLVMTALTDRCYRTMIGAVDLLYGGAPEGTALIIILTLTSY